MTEKNVKKADLKKAEDKNLLKNEENREAIYSRISRIFKAIKSWISNGNNKINELFVKSFGNDEKLLKKYEELTKINPIAIPSIVSDFCTSSNNA